MPAPAVVIAAPNLLPSLRECLANEGDLLEFPDSEPVLALQAISEQRPPLVVFERLFAATPRGAALITRIETDPQLAGCEVRVMSHTGDYTRVVKGASLELSGESVDAGASTSRGTALQIADPTSAAVAEALRQLDWHGTRRVPRFDIRSGVEIQLDGNPVQLLNLSMVGAQVLSTIILRPNQRVRVSIRGGEFVMRFRGAIAWATLELPSPTDPRYRAGVDFIDADAAAIEEFCRKHMA